MAAAAASGSGGDEAGREAAERMARREDHGGRDGRKGIHGEFKLMSLTKKKKKRSWKKQKERKKSWSLGCEDFFVKWGPRGSYMFLQAPRRVVVAHQFRRVRACSREFRAIHFCFGVNHTTPVRGHFVHAYLRHSTTSYNTPRFPTTIHEPFINRKKFRVCLNYYD